MKNSLVYSATTLSFQLLNFISKIIWHAPALLAKPDCPKFQEVVCFGIGHVGACPIAQQQFSLLLSVSQHCSVRQHKLTHSEAQHTLASYPALSEKKHAQTVGTRHFSNGCVRG